MKRLVLLDKKTGRVFSTFDESYDHRATGDVKDTKRVGNVVPEPDGKWKVEFSSHLNVPPSTHATRREALQSENETLASLFRSGVVPEFLEPDNTESRAS